MALACTASSLAMTASARAVPPERRSQVLGVVGACASLGTLLSSKVNQWTLLVGSLPVAYAIGGGAAGGIVLDARQTEEFILTAAQTLLGLAVLIDLRFALWEALALFALFAVQFPFPQTSVRLALAAGYVAIAVVLLVRRRAEIPKIASAALGGRQ